MCKKILTIGAAYALFLTLAACSKAEGETTYPSGSTAPSTTAPTVTESTPVQTETSTVVP